MPGEEDKQASLLEDLAAVRSAIARVRGMGIDLVPHRAAPAHVSSGRIAKEPSAPDIPSSAPVPATSEDGEYWEESAGEPQETAPVERDSQVALRPPHHTETLEQIRADLGECQRCKLAGTRTKIAFGEGNPKARVVFVGEGPGREEDLQGRPFVGRAGILLTDIIEKGMGLARGDVYICNVVKCRPTVDLKFQKDRPPEPDEVAACGEFLRRQLRAIAPEVIVTLGNPATKFVLETGEGIMRMRGNWQSWEGIPVMPTFHPAYVLRNPPAKRDVWEDIQKVMGRLGLEIPGKRPKGE